MNRIFTLNINNYFPELMNITTSLMKNYANKIGAEFVEIKERKFPDYHINYEKIQIYELGIDSEWNMFVDGDLLIHPDFQDITKLQPKIYLKDGFRNDTKFISNKYFKEDKRNQGIVTCFLISHASFHDIWKNINMSHIEINEQIKIYNRNKEEISPSHFQDEFALSYNLAKYKLPFDGIDQKYLFHSYKTNANNDIKLKEIKEKLKEWNIKI